MKKQILSLVLFALITTNVPVAQADGSKTGNIAMMVAGGALLVGGAVGGWHCYNKKNKLGQDLELAEEYLEELQELSIDDIERKKELAAELKELLNCDKFTKNSIKDGQEKLENQKELYGKLLIACCGAGIAGLVVGSVGVYKYCGQSVQKSLLEEIADFAKETEELANKNNGEKTPEKIAALEKKYQKINAKINALDDDDDDYMVKELSKEKKDELLENIIKINKNMVELRQIAAFRSRF